MDNFKIIPDSVFDSDITPAAKLLFSLIFSLSRLNNYCYAGNDYLAEKMKASKRSVISWINELAKIGFINIEFKKSHLGTERKIYINLHVQKSVIGGADLRIEVQKSVTRGEEICTSHVQNCVTRGEEICTQIDNTNKEYKIDNNNKEESEKQVFLHTPEKKVKSKVVNISYKLPADFSVELKETFDAFMLYKKQRKETYKSEHSINLLIKKIQDNRVHFSDTLIIEVINMTMENNWAGIFFDKLQKNKEDKKQISSENPFLKPIKFDVL